MVKILVILGCSLLLAFITNILNPTFFDKFWNGYKKLLKNDDDNDDPPKDSW